jgi:hypothetical protein
VLVLLLDISADGVQVSDLAEFLAGLRLSEERPRPVFHAQDFEHEDEHVHEQERGAAIWQQPVSASLTS